MKHRRFWQDARGFTGAEKALLICIGLAIISVVGLSLRGGSERAGRDAERTLAAGLGAVGSGQNLRGLTGGTGPMGGAGEIQRAGGLSAPAAPTAPAPAAPAPRPMAAGQPDTAYDGAYVGAGGRAYPAGTPINQIPPVRPSDGRAPTGTVVYVNGINTDVATQSTSMQAIADKTGFQVIGLHNSTNGMVRDLAQSLGDKADVGNNPAVNQLADVLYDAARRGQPIHIVAHSQGGLITSRALQDVQRRLRIEEGMSRAQAEQAMQVIQVETFGAAAQTYPNGPQYVHYINRGDPVPTNFGLGATRLGNWGAGRDARVIRFNDFRWNPIAAHGFDDIYLDHRIPFAQARRQR